MHPEVLPDIVGLHLMQEMEARGEKTIDSIDQRPELAVNTGEGTQNPKAEVPINEDFSRGSPTRSSPEKKAKEGRAPEGVEQTAMDLAMRSFRQRFSGVLRHRGVHVTVKAMNEKAPFMFR